MADFANLVLGVDTRGLKKGERALDDTTRAGRKTERATDGAAAGMGRLGATSGGVAAAGMRKFAIAATAAVGALVAVVAAGAGLNKFVSATVEADAAQAQLAAALLSTGGAAGKTIGQLNAHASALQGVTKFGDEATNAMQGVLLTFTQIQGETFDKATVATMDLATAMGTDLKAAALQVGKALNDPVLGMTALSRSGIQFTEAQKDVVKAMVATNDIAGAQGIILGELEKQFGGSAAAARDTLGGALAALGNSFGDLFELSGPATETLRESIDRLIGSITDPRFVAAIQGIGAALFGMAEIGINALSGLAGVFSFVGENIDAVSGIIIAATGALVVGFTPAIIGATVAAATFVVGLITLKGALLATGIGAVVVVAGLLIGKFLELVKGTGGFGEAFKAVAVLSRAAVTDIGTFLAALLAVSQSVAAGFSATFLQAFASVLDSGFDFVDSFITGPLNSLERALGLDLQTPLRRKVSDGLRKMSLEYTATAQAASATARQLFSSTTATSTAFEEFTTKIAETAEEVNAAAVASDLLDKSITSTGKSAGKTAPKIEELKTETEAFDAAMKEAAMTTEDLGKAKAQVLVSGIDSMAGAFGDFVSDGLKDFKSFASSIVDTFKRMLSQMIAMAVKNKILIPIAMSSMGLGTAANAANATGSAAGLTGGIAGIGSALGTGFMSSAGGFLSGGISGGMGAIGAQLSATAAGGFGAASVAASIGAVAAPLLAVAAVFSFFKKKTKELDSGIKITTNGLDTMTQSFKKVETSRFWGLSKKISTSVSNMGAGGTAIQNAISDVQANVLIAAASLNIGADAFSRFSSRIKISTKGMNSDQANAAVNNAFSGFADKFASSISGLRKFSLEGEGASDTLVRLANNLQNVNGVFKILEFGAYNVSLAGAGAASQFAQLFGSMQNFAAFTDAYYQQFFTNDEKIANATARLAQSLASLGIDFVPQTKAEFRGLVETAMLGGDSDLAAQLIMLAPAFSEVANAASQLAPAFSELSDAINTNENAFATGVDFRRGLSRAANNIAYSPEKSQAEMLAELKSLNARIDVLQSTSEITANSSSQTAENTDYTNALTLEAAT